MFQDQSRRVGRAYRWGVGSCAALALAAGTTMAQQSDDPNKDQKDQQHTMEHKETKTFETKVEKAKTEKQDQDWKSATTLPGTQSDVILAGKSKDNKDVSLFFDNGRLVEAKCDDKDIDKSKVQVKGDQLRVMGEDNTELVTFKLPSRILASGSDMGWEQEQFNSQDRFGRQEQDRTARDRFSQDRYAGGPFPQESGQYRSNQTWSTQQDRWNDQPQQHDRWETRDTWNRDTNRNAPDWNRQNEWNTRDTVQTWDAQRDAQRDTWDNRSSFQTSRERRSDSQPYYRESETRYESTNQPYFRSADEMRTQRMYGSAEQRPIVLGIIMDEADANQLRRSNYNSGMTVVRVREGTAAQRAGLREGDMVVLIDNQPADNQVLERRLTTVRSGEDVRFRVLRDGRERDIVVRAEAMPEGDSIYPRDTNMPNIDQPGPFNVYRPTRPEEWEDHMGTGGRMYRNDNRNFDSDRDVYIYDRQSNTRDQTYYRQPEANWRGTDRVYYREGDSNWRDRNMRSTVGDRDQLNRTYYTGEADLQVDRGANDRTYYVTPDSDTRFETRTYYTGRDFDTRDNRTWNDQWSVMPNERTPGPTSNYRPTRPSTSDRDIYRPSQDRR